MSTINQQYWSKTNITLLRIALVFFLLLTIPLDPAYYKRLFAVNVFHLRFQDLFEISNYVPRLIHVADWGLASYAGWGVALVIAVMASAIWGYFAKGNPSNYDQLYYWLRVLLRFRLAVSLISYGIIKLFPVQIPGPTLSDLHTAYGDFLPWKLYYLSTGVASAFYEQTLGAFEILAGLFLIFRRTAFIGASIAALLLTNIVLVNFAYQLGEHIYSLYLLIISFVIIGYDTPRLYNLLIKERLAIADNFEPRFSKRTTNGLKILLGLLVISYSTLTYAGYKKSNWPYPDTPGLKNAYGVYNVQEFKINNTILPYSATDSTRWQDVVFEKWNVLSIKANKHYHIDITSPSLDYQTDQQRAYESKGNGGRAFYRYITTANTISLKNSNDSTDVATYKLSRPNDSTIVLNGINSHNDSLHVVLAKLNKEYLLHKGRRKAVKVY